MSSLIPLTTDIRSWAVLPSRRRIRAMDRIEDGEAIACALIRAEAQIHAERAHAVGYVGAQAMHAVALVTQIEEKLAAACPAASGRLRLIADRTAIELANVVSEAARRIGR